MSFDATEFLQGLFGGEPLTVTKSTGQEPTAEVASATGDALAAVESAEWIQRPDATGRWGWESPESKRCRGDSTFEELPEPPPPCSNCGSLELWETPAGTWQCLYCDPPTTAIRLLEQAAATRRRHSRPDPPGAAEMLADLKRLTTVG